MVKRKDVQTPGTIKLEDGVANYMGDGMFVLTQKDDDGRPVRAAISLQDIQALVNFVA